MKRPTLFFLLFLGLFSSVAAQKKVAAKKYPSLFWEITGNGLKKPSYLFGTMHVSSKMAFHLSDSFYYAIRSTDAVALELNPEIWQDEMFRLQKAQINLTSFTLDKQQDYLQENSFALEKYEDKIKRALSEEPTVVNNLLYRTYEAAADFEENTYLDLYIYQTGRKLGKQPAGVENYLESEKLMMEAYTDMAKEKSKKHIDTDGESMYDIQKKVQQAYRNGDLDLMDSLQNLMNSSDAFSEKFLYLRNKIQANSIDTIMKKRSLFVGVGAAHLPGPRGVIELLRKKGYRLRPIFMQDRDASQKDEIDKMKVPVVFREDTTADGLLQYRLPGKLYRRDDARANESWQYADMNNGAYYMLTRVRTHAPMFGHSEKTVLHKVDSLLYENIPGKILKKTAITKMGYPGFDITNRTRRGDVQRYQILVTPYEVLVFKMSGNDVYAEGEEADNFFNSIKLQQHTVKMEAFEPKQGGFKIRFPCQPFEGLNKYSSDNNDTWEYECADNNHTYMVWKKTLYNYSFLEEDTFDLALMQESFKSADVISKQLSRKKGVFNNVPFLDCKYLLKDGSYVSTRAILKGPHYFMLAARSKDKKADFTKYFSSFSFTPYKYTKPEVYIDTTLKMQVLTPVRPVIDSSLQSWWQKATEDAATTDTYNSWPKSKTGIFKSDTTGESITASLTTFPRYYYSKDSTVFWEDKLQDEEWENDMVVSRKEYFRLNDSVSGYHVMLTDTGSSRCILATYYLKGNSLYKFATLTDTTAQQSEFIKSFMATASPYDKKTSTSVFSSKIDLFFADYNSKDSALSKQANAAISSIYFGKEGVAGIVNAINNLKYGDKDYFETKAKFINELGYITDSSSKGKVVAILKDLYEKNADTSSFQNPVLTALGRLKTDSSFRLLKQLLIEDPPAFDDTYEYQYLFNDLNDTPQLAKLFFPEILQLAALEDYKPAVNGLLKSLVDSGCLKAEDYESYFSKLYFDAKIEMKKQQSKDERQLQSESNDDDDDNNTDVATYSSGYGSRYGNYTAHSSALDDYAVLLMPFYDRYGTVPKFFDKMLQSKDVTVQLSAVRVLLKNKKPVADSTIASIAAKDQYRAGLLYTLEQINKKDLFPSKYRNQEIIAKSLLLGNSGYKEFADIRMVGRRVMESKGKKGNVYLFRYKVKKDDDWKMGISGMQPLNTNDISSNDDFVKLTDKKIKADEPEDAQFSEQLKRLVFEQHKSAQRFYAGDSKYDFNFEGRD